MRTPTAFSVLAAFAREGKEFKPGVRPLKGAEPAGAGYDKRMQSQKTKGMIAISIGAITLNGPMLREHIILASPMQPLCRDNCAGLCARCGKI